jgi:hypothetical protein
VTGGQLEKGVEVRVHHPSLPQEAKNKSLSILPPPAAKKVAGEDKPLPDSPRSFQNSDHRLYVEGVPGATRLGPGI